MREITYTKMHGLGNNYIYINQFDENLPEEKLSQYAIEVSNIYTGIGSDGMILICPSELADVKMRIFNKDGSEGKNCGNGLRCVAKYAYENGIVSSKKFAIETLGGLVQAEVHLMKDRVETVTIDMGKPQWTRGSLPMNGESTDIVVNESVQFEDQVLSMTGVSMGNPHMVMFVDDIEAAPLTTAGPYFTDHEMFPESINVEFVEVVSNKEFHFRVWERGSGITQACGTGACAAVVAGVLNKKTTKGTEVTVHLAGGDLLITWDNDDHVWMTGPAVKITTGVFYSKV
ncbi:diaminopimelate epimerase [Pseudalkalibacillus hwajinpoensis]|uniref:Diaminopimelate epimerase n=1 Tax=Guptibacillus hwajinpoensis TaxID=208199 RepID=A0A4U1MF11_9BACL|nr:diaminopimelate epimerase [Pseudalkalibacillus hwajinpoensis]TKD69291.1 diaminopimelate epimerase [Pseudalkalibacillus hwajinpoensis]